MCILRRSAPAARSNTTENAACAINNAGRTRDRCRTPLRAPALSASVRSPRPACRAGSTPIAIPAMSAAAAVTTPTRQSKTGAAKCVLGIKRVRRRTPPHSAAKLATAPATSASNAASVISIAASRARDIPRARRTAISRRRRAARASSRFVTLAQAMRSTTTATPLNRSAIALSWSGVHGPRALMIDPSSAVSKLSVGGPSAAGWRRSCVSRDSTARSFVSADRCATSQNP